MNNQMKITLAAIGLVAAMNVSAFAQSSSTSTSTSQSQADANSGSTAVIIQNAAPAPSRVDINNVPSVTAPAIIGGGHPCLAGKSGGFSVLGGGASYGQGDAEPICMLFVIGQQEAAIRALAAISPAACKAMDAVGYYRIGNKVVPFQCGNKVVKGGVETAGVPSRVSRVSTRAAPKARPAMLTKCEMRSDGKVAVAYTSFGRNNKEIARAQCLSSLGY